MTARPPVEEGNPRLQELEPDYEFVRELGRGGTAIVYLARERELGRLVAIKIIRSSYIEDEESAARLVREARVISRLQHANIVVLYATRRLRDGSLALIMQYVEGHTLKNEILTHGPLSLERVESVLSDVGRALSHAHRYRIVHRDIKPENIYIENDTGIARLADFGIARPWDSDSSLTLPGTAIGTPAYMSPEQIDGGRLDGRSDLYSLGAVAWEMLAGRRPWAGESLFSIIYKQKHEELPSPLDLRPGISPRLLRAVDGALRKDPEERWASADEFLAALSGYDRYVPLPERGPPPAPIELDDDEPALVPPRPQPQQTEAVQPAEPGTETDPVPPGQRRPERWRNSLYAGFVLAAVVGGAWFGANWRPTGLDDPGAPGEISSGDANDGGTARALPAAASAVGAADLRGAAGDTLPDPLSVRVMDAAGVPIANAAVRFEVVAGGGRVEPGEALTDSSGTALARWILGTAGPQSVQASVDRLDAPPIVFQATALAGAPAARSNTAPRPAYRLAAASATSLAGFFGATAASPLAVRVMDAAGRGVGDVRVQFAVRSGGGRVSPAVALTGADGTATAEWVLGSAPTQEATARIERVSNAVVFRANAGPAPLLIRRGVSAGGTHTCAVGGDGTALCWGGNDRGQIGNGSAAGTTTPARVVTPEPIASLAAGGGHSCAVGVSGAVFCWGSNNVGQLGDGTTNPRLTPVRIALSERLVSVAAGFAHTCALDPAGALYCWGQNSRGQIGDGTRSDRDTPVRIGGSRTFRSVALGWRHTCALAADGLVLCWGANANGEVGDGTVADRLDPTPVTGGYRFAQISAGSAHTCGVRTDASIACWGRNQNGRLGNGGADNSAVPVAIATTELFSAVAAGSEHTCALTRQATALCWGGNGDGQLGDGTHSSRMRPTLVRR